MLHSWQHFTFRSCITLQLIGDNDARYILQPFEELAEELLGGMLVASALHQDIKHITILINGSSEIMGLPVDCEKYLVQMPLVARLVATAFEFIGIRLPKFQRLLTDGFIRQDDVALRHYLFNITKTERKAKIQPDAATDHLGREAVASVVGSSGRCFHEAILT
jgi:hypothetical protein